MTEEIKEKLLEEIQHLYKVYMHDPDLLPEFAYAVLDLINQSNRELLDQLSMGAIPETSDYANGWNDCRKKAFEMRAELRKKNENT